MRRGFARKLVASLFLSVAALPCRAQEPAEPPSETGTVERCVAFHEDARMLRLDEKWLEAREAMKQCSEPSCPLALRSDCQAWAEELAQMMPTLVVVVERDDAGTEPVRFELDGRPIELSDPASPIELLPGRHRLHFELPPYPAVDREIVLEKGEKNRVERVRFTRERSALSAGASTGPEPAGPMPPPADVRQVSSRPVPASTYILAGGAIVALAVSGVLLASSLTDADDARDSCSPLCDSDVRESIETRLLLADVSGAAALVLGGLSIYTFVQRPVVTESVGAAAFPTGRGAGLTFRARF